MFSLVLKNLLGFLMIPSFALASEGGEAAPPAQKQEIKSSEESYLVVQARVQTLESKIRSAEEEIQKLIVEKQHTKDSKRVNEIIKQMIAVHQDMTNKAKEYEQQRALLKYRYPEKNLADKRVYERIEVKTIEDMESRATLSRSLKSTLKKVRSQYGISETRSADKMGAGDGSAKKQKTNVHGPDLIEPVIIKK